MGSNLESAGRRKTVFVSKGGGNKYVPPCKKVNDLKEFKSIFNSI